MTSRPNEPSALAVAERILKWTEGGTFVTGEPVSDDIKMAQAIVEQAQRIKRLEAALEQISDGDGNYMTSPNIVDWMRDIAREALKERQT